MSVVRRLSVVRVNDGSGKVVHGRSDRPWRWRSVRGTVDPAVARVLGGLADSVDGVLDVGELL